VCDQRIQVSLGLISEDAAPMPILRAEGSRDTIGPFVNKRLTAADPSVVMEARQRRRN